MSIVSIILAIVVIGIAVAIIAAGVKVVPQSETRVIERSVVTLSRVMTCCDGKSYTCSRRSITGVVVILTM